jgi:hypothetical protein
MSNALSIKTANVPTVKTETAPTAAIPFALDPTEYVEGAQDLTRDDLQIPHLILVQAQHADIPEHTQHVGELYNNVTNEFTREVHAVLLAIAKGRTAFARKFSRDSEPLCASDDAINPRAEYIGATITDSATGETFVITGEGGCAACPFSHFIENNGDRIAPLCAKAYSYAMIDRATGIPFVMRAQRTGTQAAKQLNTVAKTVGRRKMIRITSHEVKSDSGSYYVPVFSTNGDTPVELLNHATRAALELGNLAARVEKPTPLVETVEVKEIQ